MSKRFPSCQLHEPTFGAEGPLLKLANELNNELNNELSPTEVANNCVTVCAFLDIKSAFDAAWHQAIISALDSRKCPSYLTRRIFGFLSNRTVILSLGSTVSSVRVDLGCPQGGVLSPILWSVLIEDVLRLKFPLPSLSVGFADDLTMANYHKDPIIASKNLQVMWKTGIGMAPMEDRNGDKELRAWLS